MMTALRYPTGAPTHTQPALSRLPPLKEAFSNRIKSGTRHVFLHLLYD